MAEAGGPGSISGAQLTLLDGDGGVFSPEQLREQIHPAGDRYGPRTRLVSVEQTTNMGGGRVWPLETVRGVLDVAREHGMNAHLDGARLMNAVVASGVPAADWASGFDTAWIDFTKGLGAPVGACLAGSRELIDEAWRYKQMWGGAMRQAGIVAAAGLYALDHHVERLAEDHANARVLADGLAAIPGVRLDADRVETNIVIFEVDDAFALVGALHDAGIEVTPLGPQPHPHGHPPRRRPRGLRAGRVRHPRGAGGDGRRRLIAVSVRTEYRTCPFCEATCGLEVTLDGDAVTRIRGDEEDVLSHGFICPKATGLRALPEDPDRLRTPLVRDADGTLAPASWDEALARGRRGALARARRRRPQRRRRLPRQPQRAQPRRHGLQPRAAQGAGHAERLLGLDGRPDAQAGLGRA